KNSQHRYPIEPCWLTPTWTVTSGAERHRGNSFGILRVVRRVAAANHGPNFREQPVSRDPLAPAWNGRISEFPAELPGCLPSCEVTDCPDGMAIGAMPLAAMV